MTVTDDDARTAAVEELTASAELEWLERWSAGPVEPEGRGVTQGSRAPDLALPDETGTLRQLSEFWQSGPALLVFWRHFGCGCGADRAQRLVAEYSELVAAGLTPVVIGQGEPPRAAAYRTAYGLPGPVLSDPDHAAYRAYGLGQWSPERVLYDAPDIYLDHTRALGAEFQAERRFSGRPLVDDPWRATGEFVVRTDGTVALPYVYQYCEDFPDSRLLTAAARRSRAGGRDGRAVPSSEA
jgi:peroxiredoxin